MTTIFIDGNPYEAQTGKRLVNEIERLGFDISHRCGGHAMCTTCRISFITGEVHEMSVAEKDKLTESDLLDSSTSLRLSCQMLVVDGMDFIVLMPVSQAEWESPGKQPADVIEPPFVLFDDN